MMKCRTFIFLALIRAAAAQDDAKEDSGKVIELKSPDGSLTAYARRAPDEEVFWKEGSDGTLLAIASRDPAGNKRWNIGGLLVSKIDWSPDSKFLVMTMESSGGHSPWQFRTFTYSVADGSLRFNNLDEASPVISPEFSFEKPDTLVLDVWDHETQEKTGEEFPAKEVKVALHEIFSKMEKREELKPETTEQDTAELDPSTAESPDRHWFAATRRIPTDDWIWKSDLDGFRLVVFSQDENGAHGDEALAKAEVGGRQVSGLEWSPDSKFIVITTTSSGGHSPYHFKSYLYCMADKSLRYIDDGIGETVGAPGIEFEAPDIAILEVLDQTEEHGDFKTCPAKLPLHELFGKMPVEWPRPKPAGLPDPDAGHR